MQPRTEPTPAASPPAACGDEEELYRRHHRDLQRAVAHVVHAPRELIEDACQTAWAILLRTQPERYAIFAWLRLVAIHEAYRLSAVEQRTLDSNASARKTATGTTRSPTRGCSTTP